MNENKEKTWETLYNKYLLLFDGIHKSPMETPMAFGIECNLGWYDLIDSVCWEIKQHEDNISRQTKWKQEKDSSYISDYHPVRFDQIKEKYGGLRLYYSGGDDFVAGVVHLAESMSYKICENCGNKGQPNQTGWISTLCDGCRKS